MSVLQIGIEPFSFDARIGLYGYRPPAENRHGEVE
jgi:hypothetical protein